MTISYLKNKNNIYNWVAKNPNKYREICRIKQKRYDVWKAIQKVYFQLLL